MSKQADELLKRALNAWTHMSGPFDYTRIPQIMAEIEAYLDKTEKQKANRANDWLLVGSEPACTACLSRDIIHQFAGAHADKANELLLKALGILDMESFELSLQKEIRAHLAAEEGKQEEEPVAWTNQNELNALGTDVTCYMYAEPESGDIPLFLHPSCPQNKETATRSEDVVTEATDQEPFIYMVERQGVYYHVPNDYGEEAFPVFLHPSHQAEQKKPLSEEEIDRAFSESEFGYFRDGVRWAEKMHKIGEGEEGDE